MVFYSYGASIFYFIHLPLSLLFYILDNHPNSHKYKIQAKPKSPGYTQNLLFNVLRNLFISGPIAFIIFNELPLMALNVDLDEFWEWPSTNNWFKGVTIGLTCQEFVSYATHRAFHSKLLYKYHKQHHEYHAPVCLSSQYAHPLEIAFCNILPLQIGCLFFQNGWVLTLLFAIGAVSTSFAHCGYKYIHADLHDAHHEKFNVNFTNGIGILDMVFGTYVASVPRGSKNG